MRTLCECGCGLPAPIADFSLASKGWVRGRPKRFIHGHNPGNAKHRRCGTPEYRSFLHARQRCNNPKDTKYPDYGGRGIEFRFTSFDQFFAELGPRPDGMTLDRINNDGHYEPGNVRWATGSQQIRNRRARIAPAVWALQPKGAVI
jgi:hypothetical protein